MRKLAFISVVAVLVLASAVIITNATEPQNQNEINVQSVADIGRIDPPAFDHLNQPELLTDFDLAVFQNALGSSFINTSSINTAIVPPAVDNINELMPLSEVEVAAFQNALGSQIIEMNGENGINTRSMLDVTDEVYPWGLSDVLHTIRLMDSNLTFDILDVDTIN